MVAVAGAAVDEGEILLGLVQVAGQGVSGQAGVAEEDRGGADGRGGVLAEVVAEPPGGQRMVQPAFDLGEQLRQAGGGQGQGTGDVVGDRWLAQAASWAVSQFRPRTASAAVRARRTVSSLVAWSRSVTCRKSSTAVLLPCSLPVLLLLVLFLPLAGWRVAVTGGGGDEGGVVDREFPLPVVLLADEGEVVDAGGAGTSSPLPGSSGRALGWECRVM